MKELLSQIDRMGWRFDNTYARLPNAMLTKINPVPVKKPEIVIINHNLSKNLGLNFSNIANDHLASIFSGNLLPQKSECIAQAYAGHQFGYFAILGDGRAIIIGEHLSKNNNRFDIQFKGSGKTPYSRNADGRAALGPMLREYIISEAMHCLGIPTTRSLAVVKTGENVMRETALPGAILTRVATSHIRVGTFEYAIFTGEIKNLKNLFNYTIERHYPHIKKSKTPAIDLLKIVMEKQTKLIVDWMRVGFIHGVMNTDNMAISGETIDYGPCAFMDTYNPETVFSSIDLHGRYAYFNQPTITKWNLARFAESLLPLIDEDKNRAIENAKEIIDGFDKMYRDNWLKMMKRKLGLFGKKDNDENLINDLLSIMQENKFDYTNTFCSLMDENFQKHNIVKNKKFIDWHKKWKNRIKESASSFQESLKMMSSANPLVIPRNHKVEEVLDSASKGNLNPLLNFIAILEKPYENQKKINEYQSPADPSKNRYRTFCGT
jgi:uncharacterized protein YdiU (UPF0061 family)